MAGKVFLVGAGPGDPDLLTVRAVRLLYSADVVVHDRLVSPEIMALIPISTRRINVSQQAGFHLIPQDRINALLIELARDGNRVVRLKGGDPLVFGRGGEEARALIAAGIEFSHVPGITAAQGASSSTGVPLTHCGLATGVRYVTGHQIKGGTPDLDWASLICANTTLVVYMGASSIREIAAQLIAHGMASDTPVLAVSHATTPREQRRASTLAQIGTDLVAAPMLRPVLFIIGAVAGLYGSTDIRSLTGDRPHLRIISSDG